MVGADDGLVEGCAVGWDEGACRSVTTTLLPVMKLDGAKYAFNSAVALCGAKRDMYTNANTRTDNHQLNRIINYRTMKP